MKSIVLLCVTFSLAYADPSTTSPGSTETSSKTETKSPNSITAPPVSSASSTSSTSSGKSQYYTGRVPTFVQLVRKPLVTAHHGQGHQGTGVPQTTFIIAQPALLPQNLVYHQASAQHAQQLLNYFHSNPSAKYQFLYGYQPQAASQADGNVGHQSPVFYSPPPHGYQAYQYLTPRQYTYLPTGYQQSHQQQAQPQPQQYQIPATTYTHLQFSPDHSQSSQSNLHKSQSQHVSFVPSQHITPSLTQSLQQVSSHLQSQFQPSHRSQYQFLQSSKHPQQLQIDPKLTAIPEPTSQSKTEAQTTFNSHYYSQGPQTFTSQPPVAQLKTIAPIITGLENFTPEQQAQIKEQLSSHFGGVTQINSNSLQANNPEYQTKFRIEVQAPEVEYTLSKGRTQEESAIETQTERSSLKLREELEPIIQHQSAHHQHQPHYLQTQSHSHSQQYSTPVYTYRTPQYTKG